MNQFLFIITDYIQGKLVYPPIRRILDSLFSIGIASFLFEKFYFKYHWLDITDYKAILDFFVKGSFIVPSILFLFVHFGSFSISSIFFTLTTNWKSKKTIRKIIEFQLQKKHIRFLSIRINNSLIPMPIKIDEATMIKLYNYVKENVGEEQLQALEAFTREQKAIIESYFNLGFKAIVCITIFFSTIAYFGIYTYVISFLLFCLILWGIWWLYLGLDLMPATIRKFNVEVQRYLSENNSQGLEIPA